MSISLLKEALEVYEIKILNEKNNLIFLQSDFVIDVENNGIYKLSQDDYVIAPFSDLNELCRFVKQELSN